MRNEPEWTRDQLLAPFASLSGNPENGDYGEFDRFVKDRDALIESLSRSEAEHEADAAAAKLTPEQQQLLLSSPGSRPANEDQLLTLAKLLKCKAASFVGVRWDGDGPMHIRV